MGVERQVPALQQQFDAFVVERLGPIPENVLHGFLHSIVRMEMFFLQGSLKHVKVTG